MLTLYRVMNLKKANLEEVFIELTENGSPLTEDTDGLIRDVTEDEGVSDV